MSHDRLQSWPKLVWIRTYNAFYESGEERNNLSTVWEKVAYDGKRVRLTDVQRRHITFFHPEVLVNEKMLMDTLDMPDIVTKGGGHKMQVLYKYYESTPVTSKYLAVTTKKRTYSTSASGNRKHPLQRN